MKCCAFGTIRMDIHIFDEFAKFDEYQEIKLDEISMMLGGSVYYTASVLNEFDCDVVMYMLNISDDFSDFVRLRLSRQNINYITSKRDLNKTATTLIFVDDEGGKKMMSYDGRRKDESVLNKLRSDISQYDLFYSSFYEITRDNYIKLADIMDNCNFSFLDLSPLLYSVDIDILETVLPNVNILSGTTDEFAILLSKLNLENIEALREKYNYKYVFEKQGKNGATLYYTDKKISYKPRESKVSRDTTGCGDTFNAGVIRGLIEGFEEEEILERAVEMATTVAYEGFHLENIRQKNQ